jgi:MFS family permease
MAVPEKAHKSRGGLPPLVRALGWVSFFTDAATDLIYPLLPAFLKSLGAGGAALGIVEGVAESVGAFVKWQAGARSDSFARKKPFVVAGYTIATFVRPLLALAMAPWHVVLVRTIDRFGKGIRSAPRDALITGAVHPSERAMAFGYQQMMDNAGAVLGPLVAFTLTRVFEMPIRTVFAWAIVPGLCALATLIFGVDESTATSTSTSTATATATATATSTSTPLPRSLRMYLGIVGLFTLGASADSFLLLRINDLGLDAAWLPIVWLSLNLTKSLTNLPGGRLADRIGRARTLTFAWFVYAGAYVAFPFTQSVAVTWALILFYGLYYGLAEGAEKAIVADLAPKEARGRAFGALHAITGLAVLPANAIFGLLYGMKLPLVAFGASAACAGVAAVLLLLVNPRREQDESATIHRA